MKYIFFSLIVFSTVNAYNIKCNVSKVYSPPYNVTCLDNNCYLDIPVFFSFDLPIDNKSCNSIFYFTCKNGTKAIECYNWYKKDVNKEFICVTKSNSCNISHVMYSESTEKYIVMAVLLFIEVMVLVFIIYAFILLCPCLEKKKQLFT